MHWQLSYRNRSQSFDIFVHKVCYTLYFQLQPTSLYYYYCSFYLLHSQIHLFCEQNNNTQTTHQLDVVHFGK